MIFKASFAALLLSCAFAAGCADSSQRQQGADKMSANPEAVNLLPDDKLMAGRNSTIIGVNYVGMTVADAQRSKAFYTGAIDLKAVDIDLAGRQKPLPASIAPRSALRDIVMLRGPNSYLRLMEFENHIDNIMPVNGPGVTHICFIAPKERPIDGKFVEQGATWQSSSNAMVDMRGVGYMYGYLRDLDGLMMEVEHAPDPELKRDYWMGHVALATPNMTETLAFYQKLFGFKHFRRADNIAGPTFSLVGGVEDMTLHGGWFRIAPFYNLEIWEFTNPVTSEPTSTPAMNQIGYSLVMYETTDIEADYKRIKSAGIKLESEIVPVVEGRAFYLRDLDGNLIGLAEFDKGSQLSLQALK